MTFTHRDGRLTWPGTTSPHELADDDVLFVRLAAAPHTGYDIYAVVHDDAATPADALKHVAAPGALPASFLDKFYIDDLPRHLNMPGYATDYGVYMPNLHVLISTKSGTGQAESFFDQVLQPVLEAAGLRQDFDYQASRTKSAESVREYTRSTLLPRANQGVAQTVLLLSGDGGIVDVINGLLGSEDKSSSHVRPTIALLPLGTANALFHSLHRSNGQPPTLRPYILGLRSLFAGTPQPLPIFKASFSAGARLLTHASETHSEIEHQALYGAVVASYGFHSTLVADSDTAEWRKHGAARFGMVAQELLFPKDDQPPHAYKAQLALYRAGAAEPTTLPQTEHGYILATLVSNLEQTFTISPASRPRDGQLRIVNFGALDGKVVMDLMMKAYDNGKHVEVVEAEQPLINYEPIDGMRIRFDEPGADGRWRRVCVDGCIVQMEEGGSMDVRMLPPGETAVDVLML